MPEADSSAGLADSSAGLGSCRGSCRSSNRFLQYYSSPFYSNKKKSFDNCIRASNHNQRIVIGVLDSKYDAKLSRPILVHHSAGCTSSVLGRLASGSGLRGKSLRVKQPLEEGCAKKSKCSGDSCASFLRFWAPGHRAASLWHIPRYKQELYSALWQKLLPIGGDRRGSSLLVFDMC